MTINLNRREYDRDRLDAFKAHWPCHGLPDGLEYLTCEFAANGDLVDMTAIDAFGAVMDTHDFDGPALVALTADIQRDGYTPIVLADTDDWLEFSEANREALVAQFGDLDKPYRLACNMSLWLGGGAAPLFHVRFADEE